MTAALTPDTGAQARETPEQIASKLADLFAAHEMKTPFFASTRPYFELIVASAIASAVAAAREEERERCAKMAETSKGYPTDTSEAIRALK